MKRFLIFVLILLGATSLIEAQSQAVVPVPYPQFVSYLQNGQPNAFGCVFTYSVNTTTPLATYTDGFSGTLNQNPVKLTAGGTANIWLTVGSSYTLVVKTSGGTNCQYGQTVYTVNGLSGVGSVVTTSVAYSTTPQFTDTAQNMLFLFTLSGPAVALPLVVNGVNPPGFITFQITQGGGYSFTWPSNVIGGCVIPTTAGDVITQQFVWNGSTATAIGPCYLNTGQIVGTGTGQIVLQNSPDILTPEINGVEMVFSPGTYITLPNSAVTGTFEAALAKLTATPPAWLRHNDQTGTGTSSPVSTAAFNNALSNPSLIVVMAQSTAVGTFAITDTAGNSYLDCGLGQILYNASASVVQCFYALNTSATASNIVTLTSSANGTIHVTAEEWTGGATSSPVDMLHSNGSNQDSGTGGGQNVTSGPVTTSAADLIIGMTGVTAGTLTTGTGFNSATYVGMEYLTQSSSAPAAATWNDGTNSDPYAAQVVAFKPPSAAASSVVSTAVTDTTGILGICVANCGTTGNAVIQQSGTLPCIFDGATATNDYFENSATVAGDCHDVGATEPTSGQVLGRVISSNAGAGYYNVILATGGASGTASGAKLTCSDGTSTKVSAATTAEQVMKTCVLAAGSLNAVGKTFRLTGLTNLIPSSSENSTIDLGIGPTSLLGTFRSLNAELGGSTIWGQSFETTCVVTTAGATGSLECATVFAPSPVTGYNLQQTFTSVNLLNALNIGIGCSFSTASASNVCYQGMQVIQQLN
jgi:hypothetical protein